MGFSKDLSDVKTLIVEDNAFFRDVVKEELRRVSRTMVIHEAVDGRRAIEEVEALKPELIFMDIQLPGENGLQLTQKIRTKYPEIKVIVLTSFDCPEYRHAALQAGGVCYIPKDSLAHVKFEELIKSILK